MAAKAAARRLERGTQLGGIIDLAVIGDDEAAAGRHHRLRAGGRQIDDREPPVAERQAGRVVAPQPARVGPAMEQAVAHRLRQRRHPIGRRAPPPVPHACYAAHCARVLARGALKRNCLNALRGLIYRRALG